MNSSTETEKAFERSSCPIANVLDVFGDKWSLLIIRDLLLGKTRYGDFVQSPEKIPTNILANRLKRFEAAGVIVRTEYSQKPPRYEYVLTAKGLDLIPILEAMELWANKYVPGAHVFPKFSRD